MGRKKEKPFNNPFVESQDLLRRFTKKPKDQQPSTGFKSGERKKNSTTGKSTSNTHRNKQQPSFSNLSKTKNAATKHKAPSPPKREIDPDVELFLKSNADVVKFNDDRGIAVGAPPPGHAGGIPIYDEDAEAYAELTSLVEGRAKFDIADSDEFIEGGIEGLDRRILQKLKRGDYAFRSYLDLHGMTREFAREEVERFLLEAYQENERCVLIVHGRGHNSKDNIPVLKSLLTGWLEKGRIARRVLAFCTARPTDGGAGAMYVLLRR